jgi:hypothetical protein
MPIYGEDQCVQCGGVRVAKSKLCVDCLVKNRDFLEKEVLIKKMVIEVKKKRITCLRGLLKEAIVHGFKQNQENAELKQRVKGLCGKIREVMEDEKDRKAKNTEEG